MSLNILAVSIRDERGGSVYEDEIKTVLEKEYNVDTLNLDPQKNKWLFFSKLKYYYQLKIFRHHKKYDVLLANKISAYAGISTKPFKRKILVVHHYSIDENPYPFIRGVIHKRFFSSLNNFDTIVVVADYWKKFIASHIDLNRVKVQVIRNSFDVKLLESIKHQTNTAAYKKKYNIPSGKIIVYAGNALKIKGYQEVIKQLDEHKYFIITTGAKDGEVNHLHLKLSYTEYIQLLCIADITIILSKLQEGWNRIAHESLLCGTPVIGNDVAGLGELLHKSGQFIFKNGDNLAQLVSQAVSNSRVIEQGRNYAIQFNYEYFAREWLALLGENQ